MNLLNDSKPKEEFHIFILHVASSEHSGLIFSSAWDLLKVQTIRTKLVGWEVGRLSL